VCNHVDPSSDAYLSVLRITGVFQVSTERTSCVCVLIGNSSAGESPEQNNSTPNDTPNDGNVVGATLHEDSMVRHSVFQTLFVDTVAEPAGEPGKHRSVEDILQICTEKHDKQWKEDLVCWVSDQYLSQAIVDVPVSRSMIQTWNPKTSNPDRKSIIRKMSEM
jgi:hypothetical protein